MNPIVAGLCKRLFAEQSVVPEEHFQPTVRLGRDEAVIADTVCKNLVKFGKCRSRHLSPVSPQEMRVVVDPKNEMNRYGSQGRRTPMQEVNIRTPAPFIVPTPWNHLTPPVTQWAEPTNMRRSSQKCIKWQCPSAWA